jgi:hypothetical protein
MVALKTLLTNEAMPAQAPHRREGRLVLSLLLACAVLLVPSLVVSPDQQPELVPFVQVILCGLLLGAGRQGIDVLMLRVLVAAPVVLVGWIVGRHLHANFPLCTDSHGVACIQSLAAGVIFGAIVVAIILAVIAIPTTIAWSRGFTSLRPELAWSRAPRPRTWGDWVLVAVVALVLLVGLPILLNIPSP